MGCNVLWGPRPAAWDQEPPSTEEGLPDADWSTWIALQCEQNCFALQCKRNCCLHTQYTHTHPTHTNQRNDNQAPPKKKKYHTNNLDKTQQSHILIIIFMSLFYPFLFVYSVIIEKFKNLIIEEENMQRVTSS